MKRGRSRASYDRALAYDILDEGLVCHLGFVTEGGQPVVIPTAYARDGNHLLIHGAKANRALRAVAAGVEACLTVTLLDGIVAARSAFHTSMNYRSVMVFGRAVPIEGPEEQRRALNRMVEHALPGQGAYARPPTDREVATTLVLAMPIDEASLKVRSGGPSEEPADLALPLWGGHVPLRLVADASEPDGHTRVAAIAAPPHLRAYSRPGW